MATGSIRREGLGSGVESPGNRSIERSEGLEAAAEGQGTNLVKVLISLDGKLIEERQIEKRLLIGRAADCDLQIDRRTASSKHAVIEVQDGQAQVRDLGSTNGTFLNGSKLEKDAIHLLSNGDKVWLASFELLIQLPESEVETQTDQLSQGAPVEALPATPEPSDSPLLTAEISRLDRFEPRLVIGGDKRQVIKIREREVMIGRDPDRCGVVIPQPTVSGAHARISMAEGNFVLKDLNSVNGTYVNDALVKKPTRIESDQVLRFGDEISCLFVCNPGRGEELRQQQRTQRVARQLVSKGTITARQSKTLLEECKTSRKSLGEELIMQGAMTPEEWLEAASQAELLGIAPEEPLNKRLLPLLAALLLVTAGALILARVFGVF